MAQSRRVTHRNEVRLYASIKWLATSHMSLAVFVKMHGTASAKRPVTVLVFETIAVFRLTKTTGTASLPYP